MLTTLQITIIAIGVVLCVIILMIPTYMDKVHELKNKEISNKLDAEMRQNAELRHSVIDTLKSYEGRISAFKDVVKDNTEIMNSLSQELINKISKQKL